MKNHLFTIIPQGTKALVTYHTGKQETVTGPQKVWFPFNVKNYAVFIINKGEVFTIYNEKGDKKTVAGPSVEYIHPDADKPDQHSLYQLQPTEVLVVTNAEGKQTIYVGTALQEQAQKSEGIEAKVQAQVFVGPDETIHQFLWTGSRGDTDDKAPGSLRLGGDRKLRIQETQTYFGFEVRTQDGVAIRLGLIIFYTYDNLTALLKNDDPLGVMFNTVMAELLTEISKIKFENFRTSIDQTVSASNVFKNDAFKAVGLKIKQASVRKWEPTDPSVERIITEQATTVARQAVAAAKHQAALEEVKFKTEQLQAEQANDALNLAHAAAKGTAEAAQVEAFFNGIKGSLGEERAAGLVTLAKAAEEARNGITISPDMVGLLSNTQ